MFYLIFVTKTSIQFRADENNSHTAIKNVSP